jgi:hypothetical protein
MHPEPSHINAPNAGAKPTKSAVALSVEPDGTTNPHPAYGFKLRGPRGRRTKVPDPKERAVIQWIAEQRQLGWTWEAIYFDLLKRRVRTRAGREWSVCRIRRACAEFQRLNGVYPVPKRRRKPDPGPSAAAVLHEIVRCLRVRW